MLNVGNMIKGTKFEGAYEISKILKDNGFQCYVVGGIVRDFLLYKTIDDDSEWDLATDAKPEEIFQIFSKKRIKVIPIGIKHGTVAVIYKDKTYEITTFRIDKEYKDGRHPSEVVFTSSIEEDLARRDFTINAMAIDIIDGKFVDPFGGINDLKNKIIRAVGDPDIRFSEDGLRLMRACRFATKLEFTIEEKTLEAMKRNKDKIKNVSAERIRDELIKMLLAKKTSIGIEYMRISGLLEIVLPELNGCYGISQNIYHKYDVYTHSLITCDTVGKLLANTNDKKRIYRLKLAGLLHDIAKPVTKNEIIENGIEYSTFYNHEVVGAGITKKIMKRLRFSNDDIEYVTRLVRHHMFYYTDEWTDSAVRRFMRNVGLDLLDDLFILREADRIGSGKRQPGSVSIEKLKARIQKIIEEENAISLKDIKVNGHDIMNELGISPGPMVGKILNSLLQMVIEDPSLNEKEKLLTLAREIYSNLTSQNADTRN